ncbi:hypothetical protein [Pseudomonas nunensis]|uniref:hypothetical protein n=1 Tax=Pseudomonas nunensis TaxID=2961896 RepID=UPI0025AF2581|nr:hypothetical protein [Pseudomonas nunensis]MDN3221356.1 hypothetical protein [Pseudomonas nunensis]
MSIELKRIIAACLLVLAVWLARYIEHDTQTILIFTIVFSCGAIFAICNRKKLSVFVKNWPGSLLYTAVILYVCKISAEKAINARTGIEVENIRYASTIGGFIYSIPFSMLLISLWMFVRLGTNKLSGTAGVQNAEEKERVPALKIFFVGSLLGLGMLALSPADVLLRYAVLADATKVTTCGPVEDEVVYIRKNPDTCARIHVNLFKGIYDFTDVPGKAG